ncbi:hypothetical protein BDP27DRAFT_1336295 [Rhodocollybia butyracea]|uniref:Uncharacterized protein n=1 Tax=Rhodocollybia butyracea TaxID=206335 RepID=A0A9P5PBP1_9AGAR|nr:hypothetical protein BDP27DRAFT_1336295 [Rhodocollybia butyracea]
MLHVLVRFAVTVLTALVSVEAALVVFTPPVELYDRTSSVVPPGFFNGTNQGLAFTDAAGGLGACGVTYTTRDFVVVVSQDIFDSVPGAPTNPNNNPLCGQGMVVTFENLSVSVTVEDTTIVPGTDIVLTPAAFNVLTQTGTGVINVTWEWAE